MRYLVVLLLAGCAAPVTYEWKKDGANTADLDRDAQACEVEFVANSSPFARGMIQHANYTTECMRKKGWNPPK